MFGNRFWSRLLMHVMHSQAATLIPYSHASAFQKQALRADDNVPDPGGRIRERHTRACERNKRHGGHMHKQRVCKILEACRACWPGTAFQGVPALPSIIKS